MRLYIYFRSKAIETDRGDVGEMCFKVRKKSRNLILGQGNLKFLLKVGEKSGKLNIRLTQDFMLIYLYMFHEKRRYC